MTKRLEKIVTIWMLIIMSLGLFTGCGNGYGYEFHFDVDGGNGKITIENETLVKRVKPCSDNEAQWCKLGCADSSHIAIRLGGKKGSHHLTFVATPDEGFKVKEWLFNGEIVEGNNTTSYTAKVSSEQNYYGVIVVVFEPIPSN